MIGFTDHRSISFALGPNVVFVVTKGNDPALDSVRVAGLIGFESLNTHSWENGDVGEFVEVVFPGHEFIRLLVVEASVFFAVRPLPEDMVGVRGIH